MDVRSRGGVLLMLGPQQMPPQGARALVQALLRPSGGGPIVSGALIEQHPGETEIEFVNEGSDTAIALRYVIADADGALLLGSVGHLPPYATTTVDLRASGTGDPVRCVWICADAMRRLHVWSYDGRHKRLRRRHTASDEACFDLMYG